MALEQQLEPLLADLYYPSESDEPVEYLSIASEKKLPFTPDDLRDILADEAQAHIEPIELPYFWEKLTTPKEWYSAEEFMRVEKFVMLRHELETRLTALQGFRVGEIEVAIYVFGQSPEGLIEGIRTRSIET